MKARIISGLVLVALVIGVLAWAPVELTLALILLVVVGGAWEWSAFLHPTGAAQRVLFVSLVTLLLLAAWYLARDPRLLRLILWVAAAWWALAVLLVARGPERVGRAVAWIGGVFVLVPLGLALGHIRASIPSGVLWTFVLLALVWAADTGAYFAGRAFGRRKLAPLVSPGKTWEGVAGGLLLSMAVAAGGARLLGTPLAPMLAIGLLVAAVSVVGDLIESLFKRYAGVKDSGHLIPGHGGLMDRLDSLTAAAPVLLLCILEFLEPSS